MKKLLFLSLVLLIAACGSDTTSGSGNEGSGASTGSTSGSSNMVAITTSEGNTVGYVSSNHAIRIGAGEEIVSRMKEDKRKYDIPRGETLKVTYKDDGFKLKKESGDLLWKVKIKDEKIKISDNEENENPYEIKFYEGDRAKVKYMDQEMGDVRMKDGKVEVQGTPLTFIVDTDKFSAAYGALLINRISMEKRLIIISELLAKGQ